MSLSSMWRLTLAVVTTFALVVMPSKAGGPTDPLDEAVVHYGSGSGGGGGNLPGVATALTTGLPGSPCQWRLTGAHPGVVTYFLLGFTPLELELTGVGLPGLTLLSTYDLLLQPMLTNLEGNAAFTLGIPNNPSLVGLQLYSQWLYADATNSFLDGATNGVQVTIME